MVARLAGAARGAEEDTVGAAACASGALTSLRSIEARNAASISTSTCGSGAGAPSGFAATSARNDPVAAVHCGFGGAATNTAFKSVVSGLNSSAVSGITFSSGSPSRAASAGGCGAAGTGAAATGSCADARGA